MATLYGQIYSLHLLVPHPSLIDSKYLAHEVSLGRMFICWRHNAVHVNPLGLIPKKNKPGKWHLIVDLSLSQHDLELASLLYSSVDHLAMFVLHRSSTPPQGDVDPWDTQGCASLISVFTMQEWEGSVFVLPFAAPNIFSAVADVAQALFRLQTKLEALVLVLGIEVDTHPANKLERLLPELNKVGEK